MAEKKFIKSNDTKRKKRIPPGQRKITDFPVLHYGRVHNISKEDWGLRIFGLVQEEKVIKFREFMELPQTQVYCDIHCVTSWSRLDNIFEGVSTSKLKDLVKISPEAKFVTVYAAGGFTTNLSLEDFFGEDVLLAHSHNGKRITPEHGAPVRLVVPLLYFWKSAKWVTGIEFTAEDHPGFWERNGYHNHGDPWKEERYG